MIQCGADDCKEKPFAKCIIETLNENDNYSFHLCKKHHNVYCNTDDYKLSIELLP